MAATKRKRILFVAMCNSIHTARWMEMAALTGHELAIFPVFPAAPNALLRNVTVYYPGLPPEETPELAGVHQSVRIEKVPLSLKTLGGLDALAAQEMRLGESPQTAPFLFGPEILAAAIRHFQPDLVHSLEFQHAGYLVLKARELFTEEEFPSWLATNWGSDIYHYRNFPEHRRQLTRLLASIDLYSCECVRDVGLARSLGYVGPALPVFPNTGGFDIAQVEALRFRARPSQRRLIMIKGYQHFAGRALTSLAVLERMIDHLSDYEVVLYSMGEATYQKARDLAARTPLRFRFIGHADHDEMLRLFSEARVYMGISVSDAISTSVLEAMSTGCFPIQTNTSCCDEWYRDGEGGFIVPPDDFEMICDRFERAMTDDALVNHAAEVNWITVQARLDKKVIAKNVQDFYKTAFDLLEQASYVRHAVVE